MIIFKVFFKGVCVCVCVKTYFQAASLRGVEDKELLQQVLAVSGHVEGDTIFPSQNTLPQFLRKVQTQLSIS